MPLDAAITDLVSIRALEGTWVRPRYPAPTFGSPAEPSNRVCEAVLAALSEAAPDRSMAYSYASGINLTGSGVDPRDGSEFVYYQFGPGGCGGGGGGGGGAPTLMVTRQPGTQCAPAGTSQSSSGSAAIPVRFSRFSLRPDSGGDGQFRGGLGYEKEFEVLATTRLNAFQDRHKNGAPGIFGGEPGATNQYLFMIDDDWADATEHFGSPSPSKLTNLRLPEGSRVRIVAGGGGGWGDPKRRSPTAVERDLEYGYVTQSRTTQKKG